MCRYLQTKITTSSKKIKVKEQVYNIVRKIPKGRVMTYGQIAEAIWKLKNPNRKSRKRINPRYVGYILHRNPDPKKIPCHRVVDRNGKLAENYKFGGWKVQRTVLLNEGVVFRDNKHVDFMGYLR